MLTTSFPTPCRNVILNKKNRERVKILNWINNNIWLTIILVVGLALRFYHLDFQSPWLDELFTIINSSSDKSVNVIFETLKKDVHPPLYYYIIHFFYLFFENSSSSKFI